MIPNVITTEDADLLRVPAAKVQNVHDPKVIIAVQTMKRLAHKWEAQTGSRAEGLAATQVGIPLSILIVRQNNAMIPQKPKEAANSSPEALAAWEEYREFIQSHSSTSFDPWYTMFNPKIIESEGVQDTVEGCLSVPNIMAKIKRPQKVVFRYTLPNGKQSGLKIASDYSATVVSHEVDHLKGVLITDVAYETINAYDTVAM